MGSNGTLSALILKFILHDANRTHLAPRKPHLLGWTLLRMHFIHMFWAMLTRRISHVSPQLSDVFSLSVPASVSTRPLNARPVRIRQDIFRGLTGCVELNAR